MNQHPSYFALDRLTLGGDAPDVAAHATACPACRTHLETVRRRPAIPAWLGDSEPVRSRRWFIAFVPVVALAGLLVIPPATSYVGGKGGPVARIFVKRDANVFEWDGHTVRPGDEVRVSVRAPAASTVTVWVVDDGRLSRAFDARVPNDTETLLAPSWRVDDETNAEERLVLTFSDGSVLSVSLPKETHRDP